jgi:hypothetical protein
VLRACTLLLGCAGAAHFGTRPAAAQEAPAGYEAGLFELRVDPLPARSVSALVTPEGRILLPLRPVLELAGAPWEIAPDASRASVARPRGAGRATLDVAARTLEAAGRVQLAVGEVVVWAGDIYLAAERVGALLEGTATVDIGALTVTLARDPPFPAQERVMTAEARRRAGLGPRAAPPPSVPFLPRSGAGILEYGVTSSFPGAGIVSAGYARAGVGVWGGMLRLGLEAQNGAADPLDGLSAAYHRVFPESRVVRQVQVGDVVTEGLRARSVRGFNVTNAPFIREALYGDAFYSPRLPTGWEYEVYQGGQLLGFSTAGGAPVGVPLRYGSTPVQVRMYGPAGERVLSEVTYLVPTLQLPRGRLQYAAGGGLCPRGERCESFGYADLRGGASDVLTLLAGGEVESDSAGQAVRGYVGASLLPRPGWSVEAQAMPGSFVRLQVEDFSAGTVSGSAGAGIVWPQERGGVIGGGGFSALPDTSPRWHAEGQLRIARYTPGSSGIGVALGGRAEGSTGGGPATLRATASLSVRRALLEASYESVSLPGDTLPARSLLLGRATLSTGTLLRRYGSPLLTAGVGSGDEGLEQWEAGAILSPGGNSLSFTARWARGAPGISLVVGSSVRTGAGRARARVGTRGGEAEGGVSLDGALAFGSGDGVALVPYGGVGQAGIAGRVFHDLDGDGRFGAGDEPVGGAFVGIGTLRVKTDADGQYATWSVLPYEVLAVGLDTTTLADPSWVPPRSRLLRPAPHLYTRVDFPLARTRELTGRLIAGPGVRSVAGVTLEIVPVGGADGQQPERTMTFSDGEFYIGRLLPGSYEIRVSESSLRALNARVRDGVIRVEVRAGTDLNAVAAPPIHLVRAGG